jgi:hypothetical protein
MDIARSGVMNPARLVSAFLAAFVFMFFWGWLFNGVFRKISMQQRQAFGGRKPK